MAYYFKARGRASFSGKSFGSKKASHELAQFILEMRSISPTSALESLRGMSLIRRDGAVRKSISLLEDEYDTKVLTTLWEESVQVPLSEESSFWFHGDFHRGNVLLKAGSLSAVLDFGLCGAGDPSCDLMAAWTLLDREGRREFFSLLKADEASIKKARGWALSMGILGYPYYKKTNPSFASIAKDAMDEVLKDPF